MRLIVSTVLVVALCIVTHGSPTVSQKSESQPEAPSDSSTPVSDPKSAVNSPSSVSSIPSTSSPVNTNTHGSLPTSPSSISPPAPATSAQTAPPAGADETTEHPHLADTSQITAGSMAVSPTSPSDSTSHSGEERTVDSAAATEAGTVSAENVARIRALLAIADNLREHDDELTECVAKYEEATALGSRIAPNALGEIYLFGEGGITPNYTLAHRYFNQSADLGYPDAQHNIALLYALGLVDAGDGGSDSDSDSAQGTGTGKGGEQSDALALLFDYFAAMGGSHKAKMALGYRHLYGLGVPQSCESAVLYYSQVAEEVVKDLTARPVATVIERARLADERSRTQALEEDDDVIQYYQQSAENGDVGAQVALGQLHFYGARGVEQDAVRAARYFRAAAQQGEPNAMSNLGQMHIQGVGVVKDNDTAFQLFSEAAAQNNAAAQNGLGFMYLHGYGTKPDQKMALRFFKQAAEQGSAEAQFNLGAMYFGGVGVDKKYSTALQYFQSAGHQGHTKALFNLGQMHLNGLGTVRSCSTGIRLIKTVAERGTWATMLGVAHRHFLKGNVETALMQYARAAEEGYEVAQSNSAWLLDRALGYARANRPRLAWRHLGFASDQGNVDALRMLGDYAFYGLVLPPDYSKAAKYYTQATQGTNRNAQSMFNLGWMHQHGVGLPKDFHLAKRFYDQAMETDMEAYVPARLALTGLWAHRKYDEWLAWWDGRPQAAPATVTATGTGTTGAASAPSTAGQAKPSAAAGGSAASSRHSKPWWLEEWPLEDIVLLVLCGAFALCVYVLSQRRL